MTEERTDGSPPVQISGEGLQRVKGRDQNQPLNRSMPRDIGSDAGADAEPDCNDRFAGLRLPQRIEERAGWMVGLELHLTLAPDAQLKGQKAEIARTSSTISATCAFSRRPLSCASRTFIERIPTTPLAGGARSRSVQSAASTNEGMRVEESPLAIISRAEAIFPGVPFNWSSDFAPW